MRRVTRFADLSAVTSAAAKDLAELARAAIHERGRFCVALPGGSTPRALYGLLPEPPADWSRVEVFRGDERSMPPHDPRFDHDQPAARLEGPR